MIKKLFMIYLCLLLLATALACNGVVTQSIIPPKELKSYSITELAQIFADHSCDYNEVALIVLRNEQLSRIMDDSGENVVSVYTALLKDRFEKEEWDRIVALFEETGLNRIERSRKSGCEVVKFIYRKGHSSTKLFYCPEKDEDALSYCKQYTDFFEKLEDNWWIGFKSD